MSDIVTYIVTYVSELLRQRSYLKNSGCYYENLVPINDDAVLLDIVFPGGITVNTACVYGPSHKDDEDFWDLVKSNLDLRNSDGRKIILGDYNVTLNFSRDKNKYLTDPLKKKQELK